MIRGLIFDFGGVISRTLFETHRDTELALGLAPGTLTWQGPFDPSNDALWQAMQRGDISEREYWLTRTCEVGALLGEEWTTMETLVRRARGADPNRIIRPETLQVIEAAHTRGLKLAILSNELDLFYGQALRRKLDCLKYFETIVDATHTGILKPDARAYQSVINALALPAHECLFIDDQARNIEGAKAIGMHVVHFDVTAPERSCEHILLRCKDQETPYV